MWIVIGSRIQSFESIRAQQYSFMIFFITMVGCPSVHLSFTTPSSYNICARLTRRLKLSWSLTNLPIRQRKNIFIRLSIIVFLLVAQIKVMLACRITIENKICLVIYFFFFILLVKNRKQNKKNKKTFCFQTPMLKAFL